MAVMEIGIHQERIDWRTSHFSKKVLGRKYCSGDFNPAMRAKNLSKQLATHRGSIGHHNANPVFASGDRCA
jgi:hypothetical protein